MTFVKKNYPRDEVKQFIKDNRASMNYQQMAEIINEKWDCGINRHIVHYLANSMEKVIKNKNYDESLVKKFIYDNQGKLSHSQMCVVLNEKYGYAIKKTTISYLARKVGVTEHCKAHPVPYPKDKVMDLIKEHITELSYPKLAKFINEKLGCKITKSIVLNLVTEMGLNDKCLRKKVPWSTDEDKWLVDNYTKYNSITKLLEAYNSNGFTPRTYAGITFRIKQVCL